MKSPRVKSHGMIAVLDALGASNYSDTEIKRFLDSRAIVLNLLNEKAVARIGGAKSEILKIFTFNDTIVIALTVDEPISRDDVHDFFSLLRKFMIDSLVNKILFRGSISIGSFYANEETNTIMGQAVTDAAAWYGKADWFGIHSTPKASILIDSLTTSPTDKTDHFAIVYPVPLKDNSQCSVRAVNWPKGFYVEGITPCKKGEPKKSKLLTLLSNFNVPIGAQNKFFNSIEFYDFCVAAHLERKSARQRKKHNNPSSE